MKINQIIITETTTAGSVATVSSPLGKTQSRNASIYGDKKVGSLLKGKKTSKPYANSLNEGKVKQLVMDLKSGPDGLTDEEFKKKYGKTKAEIRKEMKAKPEPQKEPVKEADLHEEDKIIAVGKGNKLKPGLLSKPENSINPTDTVKIDVPLLIRLLEYAREDANSDMDLHDLAEKLVDRGRRGKTLTMKDYEYVVNESVQPGGVIAGGGVGESQGDPYDFLKVGKWVKFGMWNKPQEHKTGRIMKIGDGIVTVVIDGGPLSGKMVDLNLGNKSLSIKPATEPDRGLASVRNEGVAEGAKVDRMVQHIKKSEIKSGKSKNKAEDIAWATVNKRGYLDNANKKKKAK